MGLGDGPEGIAGFDGISHFFVLGIGFWFWVFGF